MAYAAGAISVVQGSVNVVGVGTAWGGAVVAGQFLKIGIAWYPIATIVDDTHLTLATAYAGQTAGGLSYIIQPAPSVGPQSLPIATPLSPGAVRIGEGLAVSGDGLLTVYSNYRAVTDADAQIDVSDQLVVYATLTAPRIVALPAAAAWPRGIPLYLVDQSGACGPTKTLTVTALSSDTINGAANFTLNYAYAGVEMISDGVGAWVALPYSFPYTLPIASAATLGGVKIGANLAQAPDGKISLGATEVAGALGYVPASDGALAPLAKSGSFSDLRDVPDYIGAWAGRAVVFIDRPFKKITISDSRLTPRTALIAQALSPDAMASGVVVDINIIAVFADGFDALVSLWTVDGKPASQQAAQRAVVITYHGA